MSKANGLMNRPVGELLSVSDMVELTGYSDQYVRRLAVTGRVRGVKIGSTWLIHRSSIEDYQRLAEQLGADDKRFGPRDL